MKNIFLKKELTDKEIQEKEGHYFPVSHYSLFINDDCNVYKIDETNQKIADEEHLLLSFRKKVLKKQDCLKAYHALEKYSQKKHNNRGSAGGLLKKESLPKYVKETTQTSKFRAYYIGKDGKPKKDHISNYVQSGIIGYFDRYDRNIFNKKSKTQERPEIPETPLIPCRMTKFTRDEVDKWNETLPLIKEVDKVFKKVLPLRHNIQYQQASETPKFQIKDTAFSTVTINYNYRTATHKDKGDFPAGFGNLIVLEKNKCNSSSINKKNKISEYSGGYLGFPQYKVCVNVRQGDFLAMDVHEWHCNTEIGCLSENSNYGRLSLVCYLRNNMIKCKGK